VLEDMAKVTSDFYACIHSLIPLVEYVLGMIKILACAGFIILGIIIDCGGVPTDHRGYIGAQSV
jgi:L-asparagine transporter-like permease